MGKFTFILVKPVLGNYKLDMALGGELLQARFWVTNGRPSNNRSHKGKKRELGKFTQEPLFFAQITGAHPKTAVFR